MAVLVPMIAWLTLARIETLTRRNLESGLRTVHETAQIAMSNWAEVWTADVELWAAAPRVVELTRELLTMPRDPETLQSCGAQAKLRAIFARVAAARGYQGFFVIAPDGLSLASSRAANTGRTNLLLAQAGFLDRVLAGETRMSRPQTSDVLLPGRGGALLPDLPTQFVAAPIRGASGEVVASLALRLDPYVAFERILMLARPGRTGETYAFDSTGRLITSSRFDSDLERIGLLGHMGAVPNRVALRDPGGNLLDGYRPLRPRSEQPFTRMAASAIAGESGSDLDGYRDYRGVPVVGVWTWDEEKGIGFATEQDAAEAYRSLVTTQRLVAASVATTAALCLGLALYQTRSTRRAVALGRRVRESEQRFRTFVEQAAESVVVTDAAGVIEYVNPAYEQIAGFTRETAIGKNPRIVSSGVHDRAFYEGLWSTILSGKAWRGHLINRRPDGTLYEQDAVISPLFDASDRITGFMGMLDDVTERVELEARLRQVQKMEAVGTLAGGIAHDFNNLLTAIMGNVGLALLEISDAPAAQHSLHQAQDAGERAAELTRQLLTLGRKREPSMGAVDVNREARNAAELMKQSLPESVTIELDLDSEIRPVRGDGSQVGQVLLNLAINARDAMRDGGQLRFATRIVDRDALQAASDRSPDHDRFVLISVSDTGQGISPEVLERIFEPFFTTKETGTGLGLSMAYGCAEAHGGWIEVDSEVGRGTRFQLYLPWIPTAQSPEPPAGTELPRGTETVLLVDDTDAVLLLGRRMLERLGYRVLPACDGRDALEVHASAGEPIDVVVTDLAMPGVGGRELLETLRERGATFPVVATSGYFVEGRASELAADGFAALLPKPFDLRSLATVLRRALDAEPPGDEA